MNKNNGENRRRGGKTTRPAASAGSPARAGQERQETHLSDETPSDELEDEIDAETDGEAVDISPNGEGSLFIVDIEQELRRSYLGYAVSTLVSRALPDVRDGFKPVQRRILYGMRGLNVGPNSSRVKSARVVGEVMGKYHPHGDLSIYATLVRMAQDFSLRYPLIDPQGNFGSIDGDPPAAQRYTECRMTPIAMEMMEDLEKDTVDYRPNYDQQDREPVVMPGKFPNFLCNGGEGIAVGMSTSMPPHNLREVVEASLYALDHPDATPDDLAKFIPGPDFPTSGLILGTNGAREAYRTGRGKVIMQAQLQIEPMDNGKSAIVVTELPYQVNKANLIKHIAELVRLKRVDGITDLNDFTDKNGMRVVIELRRDVLEPGLDDAVLRLGLLVGGPLLEVLGLHGLVVHRDREQRHRARQCSLDGPSLPSSARRAPHS